MSTQNRRLGRLVLNLNTDSSTDVTIPALAGTPQVRSDSNSIFDFPSAKHLLKRQHSLKLKQNINIHQIEPSETAGQWRRTTQTTFKTSYEESKAQLEELISQPFSTPINLQQPSISQLVSAVIRKAIKTRQERQLIIRVFMQYFKQLLLDSIDANQIEWIVDQVKLESYTPFQRVFQSGDFGQDVYLVINGQFNQLLLNQEDNLNETNHSILSPRRSLNNPNNTKRTSIFLQSEQAATHHTINRILNPGDTFGETELLSRQQRQSTIECHESGEVMRIPKESIINLLGESKDEVIRRKTEFLSQFPFFNGVSNAKLMVLADSGRIETFSTIRSTIYEVGDIADNIYFIQSGEVQISTHIYDDQSQSQQSQQTTANNRKMSSSNILDEETSPLNDNSTTITLKAQMMKRRARTLIVPIMVIGENSHFGSEEFLAGQTTRQVSAKTVSDSSQILIFNQKRLINLVKTCGDMQALEMSFKKRENFKRERIELVNQQKTQQQQLKAQLNIDLSRHLLNQHSASVIQQSQSGSISPRILGIHKPAPLIPFGTRSQTPNANSSKNDSRLHLPSLPSKFNLTSSSFSSSAYDLKKESSPLTLSHFSNKNLNGESSKNMLEGKASLSLLQNIQEKHQLKQQQRISNQNSSTSISPLHKQSTAFLKPTFGSAVHASIFSNPNTSSTTEQQQLISSSGTNIERKQESIGEALLRKRERFKQQPSFSSDNLRQSFQQQQQQKQHQQQIQQDMHKALFSNYVRDAEEILQVKQEILAQIQIQNQGSADKNQEKKKGNNSPMQLEGVLFNKEFEEGFNRMYIRKFGRKYSKQM